MSKRKRPLRRLAPGLPFYVQKVGEPGPGQLLVFTSSPREFKKLPNIRGVVEASQAPLLPATLALTSEGEFAQVHGISTSAAHRLWQGQGLATENSGESRTTRWRRSQEVGE